MWKLQNRLFHGLAVSLISFGSSIFADEMQMDTQSKQALQQFTSQASVEMDKIDINELRKTIESAFTHQSDVKLASIKDFKIPGRDSEIPVRLYTPFGKGPFPVFVYYHGGGWIFGGLNLNDDLCRNIANQAGIIVVSVDYRLAPENKYPIPLNDCYDATVWVSKTIQNFNGDPSKLAIGGDSAGGNLAAAVALIATEKGPKIKADVLIYPVVSDRTDTPTFKLYGKGYNLNTEDMHWIWREYLSNPDQRNNPLVSPLYAKDFSKLPNTLIVTSHFDPLTYDAVEYYKKLKEANVPAEHKDYPSFHGFVSLAFQLDVGKQAVKDISLYLKEQLSQ